MELPDWRTSSAGAKVRAALWLASEVGEGRIFTKAELRAAFPNVEQIDRRVRDLRPEGWRILTAQEDPSLKLEELRLQTIGGPVWEKGYRSKAAPAISEKERQAAFLADGYQCVICGVGGGEAYSDEPTRVAKLTASQVGGALRTLCDRCRSGAPATMAPDELRSAVAGLSPDEKADLQRWLKQHRRERSRAEQLWLELQRQPADVRSAVLSELE